MAFDPRPVVTVNGTLRGEVEIYDLTSAADRSTGSIPRRGRATVLTDEGGFLEVSVDETDFERIPMKGPVSVAWDCEVFAWRRQVMRGVGDAREPYLNDKGQPVFAAELAVRFVKEHVPADAAGISNGKPANPLAALRN